MATIYIINFCDQDNYCAYTSIKKAKEVVWEAYLDNYSEEFRAKYGEQDKETLEKYGYIEDYVWISETALYDENDDPVKFADGVQ